MIRKVEIDDLCVTTHSIKWTEEEAADEFPEANEIGQRLDLSRLESTWSRVVWKIPFDSTNDSSRLVEKVSRLENDSSRVEWFFSTRLDSDGQFSHGVGLDGEYWMVIGGHGDSAPITPIAPIIGNWCDWCSWRNFKIC
ncbi:unnamed protein product [Caenorhabditis angaria]|uniref:Uncharacterized protein n=1 Tax=Caenorhabditis angaria TaxID=860376 RepID=A0A9P1N439_9PELO|nr:unnamed protein product [Caenorhabditis angaria]